MNMNRRINTTMPSRSIVVLVVPATAARGFRTFMESEKAIAVDKSPYPIPARTPPVTCPPLGPSGTGSTASSPVPVRGPAGFCVFLALKRRDNGANRPVDVARPAGLTLVLTAYGLVVVPSDQETVADHGERGAAER